jgi:hypothetical protein
MVRGIAAPLLAREITGKARMDSASRRQSRASPGFSARKKPGKARECPQKPGRTKEAARRAYALFAAKRSSQRMS